VCVVGGGGKLTVESKSSKKIRQGGTKDVRKGKTRENKPIKKGPTRKKKKNTGRIKREGKQADVRERLGEGVALCPSFQEGAK